MLKNRWLWIAPLLLGIALPLAYWYFFVRDYVVFTVSNVPIMASGIRFMEKKGVRASEYKDVAGLDEKVNLKKQSLTDEEWRRAVRYFASPQREIYLNAVTVLRWGIANGHAVEVRDVTLKYLDAPLKGKEASAKEAFALVLLRETKSPRWKAECQKRVNRSDQFVRDMAQECLEKGDPK